MDKATWAFLGSGAGIGAGLMYLLDPQEGKQRRVAARDKAMHACSVSGQAVRRTTSDLAHRSRGLVASAGSRLRGDGSSDRVLAERLRSRLRRWVEHPGAIEVEVNEGRAVLRGHALSSEIDNLLTRAVRVKGIYAVENQLELHESADGVAELQNGASKRSSLKSLQSLPALLSFSSLPKMPQMPQMQLSQMTPRTRLIAGTAGGALAVAGLVRMLRRP